MTDRATTGRQRGWERNDRDRLALGVDATPGERLAWLEEALQIAYRAGSLPRRDEGAAPPTSTEPR